MIKIYKNVARLVIIEEKNPKMWISKSLKIKKEEEAGKKHKIRVKKWL